MRGVSGRLEEVVERAGEHLGVMVDRGQPVIAVDANAVAGRDTGDLSALLTAPVGDTGQLTPAPQPSATTDALIAPVGIRPARRGPRRSTGNILPGRADGTDRLLSGGIAGMSPVDDASAPIDQGPAAPITLTPSSSRTVCPSTRPMRRE